MFYACLSILLLLLVILCCVCLSIIDLDTYNFGLYIVLLCIVGTMLACALCVANPNACPNPVWYSNFCLMLQEMYPSPAQFDKAAHSSSEMNGIRSRLSNSKTMHPFGGSANCMPPTYGRMMAMQVGGAPSNSQNQSASGGGNFPLRQESRATVAMLAPAVHIMHQVWRGMAWVADGIEEEEEPTKSYERAEQGTSRSCSQEEVTDSAQKRLSTIAESSNSVPEEVSSEFASGNDIMI